MEFEILDRETKYEGKVFNIVQDRIKYPDDRIARFDYIQHGGAVTILPIDEDGNIFYILQYRHPTGEILLELPAGTLEKGEEPAYCAGRELQEEIGMAANNIELLGEFYLAPGYSSEYMYVFLATGLKPGKLPGDVDEYIEVEKCTVKEFYTKMEMGEIRDAKTYAVMAMAQKELAKYLD